MHRENVHYWAAVVSRGWAKASACSLQVSLSCAVLCQIVSLQYLSRSSLHRLAGLPLSSFLVIWSPSGNTRGPSVVFEAADMPCLIPFHFSHIADYIYDFCLLPDPDVGLSILVCDVEHSSFRFGLCGRKFVLCSFGQCPDLCTICLSWQHAGVVHLSLQADGKIPFEDIPVIGVCRPTCHDSSMYLFVLVLFLEVVALSQVYVAFNISIGTLLTFIGGVVYNNHLCLCDVHRKTHSPTFIG